MMGKKQKDVEICAWRDAVTGLKVRQVKVIDRMGRTQWPTLYNDGAVGYDFPEFVSETKKIAAKRALLKLHARKQKIHDLFNSFCNDPQNEDLWSNYKAAFEEWEKPDTEELG